MMDATKWHKMRGGPSFLCSTSLVEAQLRLKSLFYSVFFMRSNIL